MSKNSNIPYCHDTFNPWWGCEKKSPGCMNCYAEALANRMGFSVWGPPSTTDRRLMGPKTWAAPFAWNELARKANTRRRVFCGSMCDIFEDHPQVESARADLWLTIENTPWLDWLLITKRIENANRMLPSRWYWNSPVTHEVVMPKNIWIGVTAENQNQLDARWQVLADVGRFWCPKHIFLSMEPLLGYVDIEQTKEWTENTGDKQKWGRGVDWVIVGGESGPHAREMNLDWARSIRDQCREYGIPFWFKQVGGKDKAKGGNLLDGKVWQQLPDAVEEPISEVQQLELF